MVAEIFIIERKIDFISLTAHPPMCIKVNFVTVERCDAVRKYIERFFPIGEKTPEQFVDGALVGESDYRCRLCIFNVVENVHKLYVSLDFDDLTREQFDRVAAILADKFEIYV
jgi:hypothetical protein